jgi:hypothetical protein
LGGQYQVERISAGGRNLSSANVESLVQAMAGFAVPSAGQTTLAQTTLSDVQKNQLSALVSVNWG